MKFKFQLMLGVLFLSSCTSFNKAAYYSSLPTPPNENQNIHSRYVASDYVDTAYKKFFADGNYYIRTAKVEAIAKELLTVMPYKGHPKRKLVEQFVTDVGNEVLYLSNLSEGPEDKSNAWLPMAGLPQFKEKIMSLGRVAQSYKIMTRAGIYLTASGVFETDSSHQDFYLSLLDRATYEIETGLRDLILVYRPEYKEADENNSKINYSKKLASDVRNNLRKVLEPKSADYKKVDAVLSKISKAVNTAQAKKLIKTADFISARSIMQAANNINSGDIEGFQDDMDTTISTKFNLELINELILSTR